MLENKVKKWFPVQIKPKFLLVLLSMMRVIRKKFSLMSHTIGQQRILALLELFLFGRKNISRKILCSIIFKSPRKSINLRTIKYREI